MSGEIRFIDLFCGIGGFRFAAEAAGPARCVFSSDIDAQARKAYAAQFGETPSGDITKISASDIPEHDLLLAGFPCQPFSIMGRERGFEDTRGTLFFDIARILEARKPAAFLLENVKRLARHDHGRTLERILATLRDLGYHVRTRILNALDFGLPQKRERIWLVGFREPRSFHWPEANVPPRPLAAILEKSVAAKHYASARVRAARLEQASPGLEPEIWHENKSGHVSALPYSCALRAGASHNYLLVNGERRLTPREMLRLQGFPEKFRIVCSDCQTRKQAGNSLPVNVATAILREMFRAIATCDLSVPVDFSR